MVIILAPNSFRWTAESGSVYDDGEGNLIFQTTGEICGNIFYYHGIAIITSDSQPSGDVLWDSRFMVLQFTELQMLVLLII